jgi:hypothetical protein
MFFLKANKLLIPVFFLAVLSLLFFSPSTSEARTFVGKVTFIEGTLEISVDGKKTKKAKVKQKLYVGDTLNTLKDSKVQLTLEDSSIIYMAPESNLTVTDFTFKKKKKRRNVTIKTLGGKLRFFVRKMMEAADDLGGASFKVETPTALLGVKGTHFVTDVNRASGLTNAYLVAGALSVMNILPEINGETMLAAMTKTLIKKGLRPSEGSRFSKDFLDKLLKEVTPAELYKQENACITKPIKVASASDVASSKVKGFGKGLMGSVIGQASGGMIGVGGGGKEVKEPKLAKKPKYPKTDIKSKDGKSKLELSGAVEDGTLKLAQRIKKSPRSGAPHLMALQDRKCRLILPARIFVYELWVTWTLEVNWTKSYYQDGQLVSQEHGGWTDSWTDLLARYSGVMFLPGIWEDFGGKPFKGVRSVIAEFELPKGEKFNPEDWSFITHITRKAPGGGIITAPIVTNMTRNEDGTLSFKEGELKCGCNSN